MKTRLFPFLGSVLWGGFLVLSADIFMANSSRHVYTPAAALFALVLTTAAAALTRYAFRIAVPARAAVFTLSCAAGLAAAFGTRIICGMFSLSGGLSVVLPLTGDVLAAVCVLILPVISARLLFRSERFSCIILLGTGTGAVLSGILKLYSVNPFAGLGLLSLPFIAASFLAAPPRDETAEYSLPESAGTVPRVVAYGIMGILAGSVYVWIAAIRGIAGMNFSDYPLAASVIILASGAGCCTGYAFRAKMSPRTGFLLLFSAGSAVPLFYIASRGIISSPTLFRVIFLNKTAGLVLLTFLICGIPLVPAFTGLFALTRAGSPKRSRIYPPAVFTGAAAAGLATAYISSAGISLCIHGALISAAGLTGAVYFSPVKKLLTGILCAIPALLLFAYIGSAPALTDPLIYNGSYLSRQFSNSENIPRAVSRLYRIAHYAEYPGGYFADIQNRKTLTTYTCWNGRLYAPGEFYRDDCSPLFLLARILTGKKTGTVLYGGFSGPSAAGPLFKYFSGCRIVIAEDLPGHTRIRAACTPNGSLSAQNWTPVRRDIRGILNSAGGPFGCIISIPPLPSSAQIPCRYSTEFFKKAKDCLERDGLFIHMLPCYKVSPFYFRSVLASFAEAFGSGSSVWTFGTYCILAGSGSGISITEQDFRRAFKGAEQVSPFSSPDELLACFIANGDAIQDRSKDIPLLRDTSGPGRYQLPPLMSDNEIMYRNYEFLSALHTDYSEFLRGKKRTDITNAFFRGREYYLMSRLSWINGNIKLAKEKIEEAIRINPEDALLSEFRTYMAFRKHIALARDFHNKSRHANALEYFKKASRLKKLSPVHIAEIGEIHLSNSRMSSWPVTYNCARNSLEYFARCIHKTHDFSRAKGMAAEALLVLNLAERAERVISEVTRSDPCLPKLSSLKKNLAQVVSQQHRQPDAAGKRIIRSALETLVSSSGKADITLTQSITTLASAGPASMPFLEQTFRSAGPETRKTILHVMARIGGDPVIRFLRDTLPAMDEKTAVECFDMIKMFGDRRDIPFIGSFAAPSRSPAVRSKAVITLGSMKHPEAVPFLCDALTDPEKAIRMEALKALSQAHPVFKQLAGKGATPATASAMKKAFSTIGKHNLIWPFYPGEPESTGI